MTDVFSSPFDQFESELMDGTAGDQDQTEDETQDDQEDGGDE